MKYNYCLMTPLSLLSLHWALVIFLLNLLLLLFPWISRRNKLFIPVLWKAISLAISISVNQFVPGEGEQLFIKRPLQLCGIRQHVSSTRQNGKLRRAWEWKLLIWSMTLGVAYKKLVSIPLIQMPLKIVSFIERITEKNTKFLRMHFYQKCFLSRDCT